MDYEKKYKDLVEAIKELQEANPSDDGIQKWVKDNVPELKEIEDERIRKSIIGFLMTISSLKDGKTVCNEDFDSKAILEWVAWLEKQGEHARFIEAIQVGDKVTKNEDGVLVNLSQLKRVAKPSEQNQGEQKPAWSEEDKEMHKKVETAIDSYYAPFSTDAEKMSNWLKNLKDRVLPQPKQEWSEEDENMIEAIEALCDDKIRFTEFQDVKEYTYTIKNWLKELKDRYTKKPIEDHYELEEFAKIVRGNLTGISNAVQELFEAKYLQLTGNKMYDVWRI